MDKENMKKDLQWAYLIHLGYNMWFEEDAKKNPLADGYAEDYCNASSKLRFDKDVWDELIDNMSEAGINMLVIDLGEGVRYESHPEIAVEGSLSVEELYRELQVIRSKGIIPIPKLNFSAAHDEWMGEYSRCVSSRKYYEVCKDLINEVIEIFDTPPYFHLGMDEETNIHQLHNRYAVIRHGDQWWHDLYYLAGIVGKKGVRPWVWSDYIWNHEEEFLRKMPKEILQSNWYYSGAFTRETDRLRAYNVLSDHGYDQIPAGSNWSCQWNFEGTVNYCLDTCDNDLIKGFMQTVWRPTVREVRFRHLEAIDIVRQVKKNYISKNK